jgi:hypothetical protein
MSKRTKTRVTVAVEFDVEYDPDRKDSLAHVVGICVNELPISLTGASTAYGSYSVERRGRKLLPLLPAGV